MIEVLSRAGGFVLIIVIAYILKQRGVFKKNDFSVLSKMVVKITLPCAIISNFNKFDLDFGAFSIFFIAIGMNALMSFLGYLVAIKKDKEEKAFNVINYSGYNIGCFTLPFVQSFLEPTGIMSACLFDAGNAIMCTGANYSTAVAVKGSSKEKITLGVIFKNIFSSNTVLASLLMIVLGLFNLKLPQLVLEFASIAGSANGFIAMFVIGLSFEIKLGREKLIRVLKVLFIRYTIGAILAFVLYNYTNYGLDVRIALMFICFSPVSSVTVPFTEKIEGDVPLASSIISLNILVSICIMTTLLFFI